MISLPDIAMATCNGSHDSKVTDRSQACSRNRAASTLDLRQIRIVVITGLFSFGIQSCHLAADGGMTVIADKTSEICLLVDFILSTFLKR